MITFDEMDLLLDSISFEIPEDFYKELNGGIILSPGVKLHPESRENEPLYILGEYHNDRQGYGGLGRYIMVYYGSFLRVHPNLSPEQTREELKNLLMHEFTHHLESLAGERGLEIKDEIALYKYKRRARE